MTLPNFLVIGAPKAGTGSLHDYLRSIPRSSSPPRRTRAGSASTASPTSCASRCAASSEYEALFAGVRDEKAIGESTALYFWSKVAPQNIKATIPDARLIVSLREPVQRAFSIYHMNLRTEGQNEGLSFLQALKVDPILQRTYHAALAAYLAHFDRSRMKVVLFEDLSRDTLRTVQSLFDFLGVDPGFEPDLKISNPGGVPQVEVVPPADDQRPPAHLVPHLPARILGLCRQGPAQPQPRQEQDADDRGGAGGRATRSSGTTS